MTTMEIDSVDGGFSFNLLQLIKTAQTQHGLRQNDHKRYRRYCSDRLRRLYKSLKFTHGRGKFVKKSLVPAVVNDVRHLHIALYSAERAWSYAMDIKESSVAKTQHHLFLRLKKACKWASLLETLCNEKADARTSLEAVAYAAFMWGTLFFETKNRWNQALRKLKISRDIYEELGRYGDVESQLLCRQRVDELEPNIRYCMLMIRQGASDMVEEDTVEDEEALQEKLKAVISQARTQQEISTTTIDWLGQKHPVQNNKTLACVLKAQELEKELLKTSLTAEKKAIIYDKLLAIYQEARKHIRDDLVVAGNADDMRDNLNGLDKAVSCLIFAKTIEKTGVLASAAKELFNRHQKEGKLKESLATLGQIVTLHDTVITNVIELSDLVTSGREPRPEETSFAAKLAVEQLVSQAERCLYLGHSYSITGKHAKAFALFSRALERAQDAAKGQEQQELNQLVQQCRTQSCLAHARGIMESIKDKEKLDTGIATLSLKDAGYLVDNLEAYKSCLAAVGSKEQHRICEVPPSFKVVPCRPFFVDAIKHEYPSLEARLKGLEKKKGFLGRWW